MSKRFERLREHYSAAGHDQSVPGADRHGRYAVLAECGDRPYRELIRCSSRARAQMVCAAQMAAGWKVLALFDIDTLAGDEPPIQDGDTVQLKGEDLTMVVHSQEQCHGGGEWRLYDADGKFIRESEAEIVERGAQFVDPRWPVKYEVAGVVQQVVFNTVPSS